MNLLLQSDSLSNLPKESPIEDESSKQSNTYSFEDSNTSSFENFKVKESLSLLLSELDKAKSMTQNLTSEFNTDPKYHTSDDSSSNDKTEDNVAEDTFPHQHYVLSK
jgi:hypothetical protein